MTTAAIHDRGRGPELAGTRTTVYDLLPYFLDPAATEDDICRASRLTPEQVAAARAYVFRNLDTMLDEHLKIEARIAAGNPPEVDTPRKHTHATLLRFNEWLSERDEKKAKWRAAAAERQRSNPDPFPTFREWLIRQDSEPDNDT